MPGFDKEIARTAQRLLINPRRIDYHTGVLATKVTPGVQPVLTSPARVSLLYTSEYIAEDGTLPNTMVPSFQRNSCCKHQQGLVHVNLPWYS